MHSTSLVDHFRGLLAPHSVQTSLWGGGVRPKKQPESGPTPKPMRLASWGLVEGP